MTGEPEVWLRGPVPGVPAALQPVAHALLHVREEVARVATDLEPRELWQSLGGEATIGFHLRHMMGSLDRLFTYARGEPLSEVQRVALREERQATPEVTVAELVAAVDAGIDRALAQLRDTPEAGLDAPRAVGRAALPSTVRGLLHHAAEHTVRHAGQAVTTSKIMRALRGTR